MGITQNYAFKPETEAPQLLPQLAGNKETSSRYEGHQLVSTTTLGLSPGLNTSPSAAKEENQCQDEAGRAKSARCGVGWSSPEEREDVGAFLSATSSQVLCLRGRPRAHLW